MVSDTVDFATSLRQVAEAVLLQGAGGFSGSTKTGGVGLQYDIYRNCYIYYADGGIIGSNQQIHKSSGTGAGGNGGGGD